MIDDQTREDLRALIASPGWRWFVQYATESWIGAEAYRRRMREQLGTGSFSELAAVDRVAQVVEMLLDAPRQATHGKM